MKSFACLLVAWFTCGFAFAEEKRPTEKAFKGMELYSWKEVGGGYAYVILTGTNREKEDEEIRTAKNQIRDLKELSKQLNKLAEGEFVCWVELTGFDFPPKEIRAQVKKIAKEAKVEFSLTSRINQAFTDD